MNPEWELTTKYYWNRTPPTLLSGYIGVARGPWPPEFSAYLVILRLEKRCPKQDTVAGLRSNKFGLDPPLNICNDVLFYFPIKLAKKK